MADPSSTGAGHTTSPLEKRVAISCPHCFVSQQADGATTVAECRNCGRTIHCLRCGFCLYAFAVVQRKGSQCPCCLRNAQSARRTEVDFATLAAQQGSGSASVEAHAVAANTYGAAGSGRRHRRGRLRWFIGGAGLVIVLALGGYAIGHRPPASPPRCDPVRAASSLTVTTRRAHGASRVAVRGFTVNRSSRPLHRVVVIWAVTYDNRKEGAVAATSILRPGATMDRGATVAWTATAPAGADRVAPTGVRVLHTYTSALPACLT